MKLVLLRMFPFKVMLTRELKMDKTTLQLELPTRLFFFFFFFGYPTCFVVFIYLLLNAICFRCPACFGALCICF